METFGCDFSFTKPNPTALKNAGYSFVLGYISNDPSKDLSAGQIAAYHSAGLKVGLVFETTAGRVLSGSAGGKADGSQAHVAANARGYAANAPIFYAVDFDATTSQYATIDAYGREFNLTNVRPVGPYAHHNYIEHAVTPGMQPNSVGWQTAAWSGGLLSAKASIYQRSVHYHSLVVPANQFDEDVICRGIVLHGGTLSPGGTPLPTPPPPLRPIYYRVVPGDTVTAIANAHHVTVSNIAIWNKLANPGLIYPNETLIVGWH